MIVSKSIDRNDRVTYTILHLNKENAYVEEYVFKPEIYNLRKTLGNVSNSYNQEDTINYLKETEILVRDAIKDLFL